MTTVQEEAATNLLTWLHEFSDMIESDLPSDADLDTSLEWFSNIPPEVLDAISRDNPSVERFLEVGRNLMHSVASE